MAERLVATVELPLPLGQLTQVLGALTSTGIGQGENVIVKIHDTTDDQGQLIYSSLGIFVKEVEEEPVA